MTTSLLQFDGFVWLLLMATMIFAGLVHGTLGLGFPMVATPLIAVFLDVKLAILFTLLPTASVNVASIWGSVNYTQDLKKYWPLALASLVGALIGAQVIAVSDPGPFRLVLAILILIFLWASYAGRLPRNWLDANPVLAPIAFGLAAGFSAGTTNVMVAVLIVYFLSLEVPRKTMVPVLNTCFLIGKLSQIVVFWLAGLVGASLMYQTAPLAIVAVAALLVGQRLQDRVSVEAYKKLLHGLLVFLAVILVVQFFWHQG